MFSQFQFSLLRSFLLTIITLGCGQFYKWKLGICQVKILTCVNAYFNLWKMTILCKMMSKWQWEIEKYFLRELRFLTKSRARKKVICIMHKLFKTKNYLGGVRLQRYELTLSLGSQMKCWHWFWDHQESTGKATAEPSHLLVALGWTESATLLLLQGWHLCGPKHHMEHESSSSVRLTTDLNPLGINASPSWPKAPQVFWYLKATKLI